MKINIPLSEQVPDVETSKLLNEALKKAGVEVEGNYFYFSRELYVKINSTHYCHLKTGTIVILKSLKKRLVKTYTLPEMLAVLPEMIIDKYKIEYEWNLEHSEISYICGTALFLGTGDNHARVGIDDKTNPATAVAKLIIWCVENGHIGGGE
jgi:hypothetical protein